MSELRPFALLRTGDQWTRCSFDRTDLDFEAGVVGLAWTTATSDSTQPAPPVGGGLAFDRECRLYHSVAGAADPGGDRVDRILWKATDPTGPVADQPPPSPLFAAAPGETLGEFTAAGAASALVEPRGLAVDVNDRLFVAETGADRVLVYDLWSDRLMRRVSLPGGRPTDLAAHGIDVYAVLAGAHAIVRLTASAGPEPFELPVGCADPSRIAVSPGGRIAVLEAAATSAGRVWFPGTTRPPFAQPWATDLEWESESVIVVARRPEADFLRYQIGEAGGPVQLASLRARQYDGLGIVATPSPDASGCACAAAPRRIGYWTTKQTFRNAVAARLVYEREGRVTTYRLDSGAFQTVWGRLFVDACIPDGSDLRVHYIVIDEADDETEMLRWAPANLMAVKLLRTDLSPPMPPSILAPGPGDVTQPLHERESGRELPWTQPAADDRFRTYEAPINAPAGRYLWITFELTGNTRVTPRVKCVRAEHPSHDYLRRLPRTFSRDQGAASFLLRYLAIFEGFLGEVEARGVDRDLLLDPCSTPDECLPWLASFVGLTLDERWSTAPVSCDCETPVDARRRIIKEAVWLFRFRGTLPGLKRFIELYVGTPVVIIEHYRLRGAGAVRLGADPNAAASAVVGAFRIGGAVGAGAAAGSGSAADAFKTHAHRFTVIVPARLTADQLDVVTHIIQVHRPAHTIFDVCTVGAGMRVGLGLMLEVSSVVGATGAFTPFQIGAQPIGRGAIVGRPAEGGTIGSSRVGRDSRIG